MTYDKQPSELTVLNASNCHRYCQVSQKYTRNIERALRVPMSSILSRESEIHEEHWTCSRCPNVIDIVTWVRNTRGTLNVLTVSQCHRYCHVSQKYTRNIERAHRVPLLLILSSESEIHEELDPHLYYNSILNLFKTRSSWLNAI